MAPIADDPHRLILEGSQKHGHRLEDLERAQKNARHARAAGFGKSRRWLWMTLVMVVAVIAVVAIYQLAGPSDAALPGQ